MPLTILVALKGLIIVPVKQPLYAIRLLPISPFSIIAELTCIGCVSAGKFKAMEFQAHLSDSLYTQSIHLTNCQMTTTP